MQLRQTVLSCACAALWLQPAIAQQHAGANPADPRAENPSPQYQSAFDGYRPFRDEKLAPWREVNEEAARIGGQIGIFGGGRAVQSSGKTIPNTPVRPATAPQTPRPMNGPGHQGMKK